MSDCGNLIKDSNKCRPPVAGVEQTLFLIDYNKVLSVIKNIELNVLTDILTESTGFFFKGIRISLNPLQEFAADANINFIHRVSFLILEVTSLQKKQIRNMARGKYVAFILNQDKTVDSSIEIYGIDYGLEMQAGVIRALNSVETSSAFQIELLSNQETDLPVSFFNNNYADSLALLHYRILAAPRFNFLTSNEGFADSESGDVYWNYNDIWEVVGTSSGDISGILQKIVPLPNDKKLLFGIELTLTGADRMGAGQMTLDILNSLETIFTYESPDFDYSLNQFIYFYKAIPIEPFTLGFKVTFNNIANFPKMAIRACGIARLP